MTDGTSARAMLLLRLAAEGACVSFGDSGAVDDGQEDAVVHVQPLRDLLPTVPTEFCPALSQLRREVEDGVVAEEAVPEDEGGFLAGADDDEDGCRFDDGDDVGGDLEGALDAGHASARGALVRRLERRWSRLGKLLDKARIVRDFRTLFRTPKERREWEPAPFRWWSTDRRRRGLGPLSCA